MCGCWTLRRFPQKRRFPERTARWDHLRIALLAIASRGTGPERPVKCRPDTTTPQCIPCTPCRRVRTRHSQAARRGPGNRASRRPACGTWHRAASIQPSIARFCLRRISGLQAPIHPSPLSHRPSWAFLASSLPPRSGTSKPRRALGRGSRNDVALACESLAVHWPLPRPCPCTFGISPFLRTRCIDRPLEARRRAEPRANAIGASACRSLSGER
jgi:hypothetical protein